VSSSIRVQESQRGYRKKRKEPQAGASGLFRILSGRGTVAKRDGRPSSPPREKASGPWIRKEKKQRSDFSKA